MTNFLHKLMFWRKSPDAGAPGPVPSGGANDNPPQTQEELDYQEQSEEKYLEERQEQDDAAP
jgi:hypothetical protein